MRDQFVSLLRLRAAPPAVSPGFVRRAGLEDRLTAAAAHPVTLISAGPGDGKTMTLASWSRGDAVPGPVAWLALDETDNDLQTFWSDLLGALTLGDAVPADSALREVVPAAGFGAREALLVRAGLADLPHVVVLVLDDFHHVTDPGVLESFGQLLDHQPPQLRLMVATRSDPALRLHRMRVNGDLTDIRAQDLAFTAPEAAELFVHNGFHLTDRQLGMLLDRTRGWVAGLRLAMMCLDRADIDGGIARFTGSERLVAEYLIEEVMDRLPEQDREFLLTTSVADRLSGGLANALTGRGDGQRTLERLAVQNALLVGLAGSSEWFSVHPLLREMLLHRLTSEQPVTELYLRASRWFADQGQPIEAIRHASSAGQWDEVGRLLTEQGLPQVLTPRRSALIAALAPAAARARTNHTTSTLLAAAVCHFQRQDFDAMIRDTNDAAELAVDVGADDRHAADVLIALLRVVHSRSRNPVKTRPAADHLVDLIDRAPRRHLPALEHYRVLAVNNIAIGQFWAGDLAAAHSNLSTVQVRCAELGVGMTEVSAKAYLALLDAIHGRLPDAHRRAVAARDIVDRRGWASEPQALALYAALAMTHVEWNQLDAAAEIIDSGLGVSESGSDVACRLAIAITGVSVAVARRDPAAARAAAARLDAIAAQAGELPPMLARWCAVAHADACLIAGEPEAAITRLDDHPEPSGFAAALEGVVLAKAHLMVDRPDTALAYLDPVVADPSPYRAPLVEAKILTAIAADRMHRDTAALGAIDQAIDLAQGVGIVRPFLAAGSPIAALIARHRHVVARHLDFTRDLIPASNGDARPISAPAPCAEPLTERELAVLSYLPTMFKAGEIASDLFVTVNTIKTHQRSIYRKLGVVTRRDAVTRARDLNLL